MSVTSLLPSSPSSFLACVVLTATGGHTLCTERGPIWEKRAEQVRHRNFERGISSGCHFRTDCLSPAVCSSHNWRPWQAKFSPRSRIRHLLASPSLLPCPLILVHCSQCLTTHIFPLVFCFVCECHHKAFLVMADAFPQQCAHLLLRSA